MAQNLDLKGREALAQEGTFEVSYGKEWFVKIKDALSIGKVVFSFVNKHNAKDEHFDIYLDVNRFLALCADFESRVAFRVLAEEKAAGEKYPKFYRFLSGENGERSIGIGPSDVKGAIVLYGEAPAINGKLRKAVMVANATAFFASAKFWLEVAFGSQYVAEGSVLYNLRSLYWGAEKERAEYYHRAEAAETADVAEATEFVPVEDTPAAEVEPSKPEKKPARKTGKKTSEEPAAEAQIRLFVTEGAFFPAKPQAESDKPITERTMKIQVHEVSGDLVSQEISEIIFYYNQRSKAGDFYDRLVDAADNRSNIRLKLSVIPCGVSKKGLRQYVFCANAA